MAVKAAQATDIAVKNVDQRTVSNDAPDPSPELGSAEGRNRWAKVVQDAGGPAVVSRLAGIPLSTLKRITDGQDPKFGVAVQLADKLGISLEWLAHGREPVHSDDYVKDSPIRNDTAHVDVSPMEDSEFQTLLDGLGIAEDLQPNASPEARISAALRAVAQIRRRYNMGPPPVIDVHKLGVCLAVAEQLIGRDRSAARRLRAALGAYRIMLIAAAEPEPLPEPAPFPGRVPA